MLVRVNSSGASVGDDQGVLDPDTAVAREVHPRLHGDGHAGGQSTRAERPDARRLVDLQAHAVPEAVREVLAVAGVGDDLARLAASTATTSAPDRERRPAGGLRRGDQLVDLPLPVRRVPEDDGARHVGVVAVDRGAEVELQEVAVAQHGRVGPVVRDRRVGAGGHDRLERRRLGAEREHPRVELAAHLPLGAAGPQRPLGGELGQRPVGDGAGPAQRLDLVVVLDRPLAPRRRAGPTLSSGRGAAGVGQHLLQGGQAVDGEVVRLEAEPAGAARTAARASAGDGRRSTSSSTSGTCAPAWVVYRPSVPSRSAPSVRTSSAPLDPVKPVR